MRTVVKRHLVLDEAAARQDEAMVSCEANQLAIDAFLVPVSSCTLLS